MIHSASSLALKDEHEYMTKVTKSMPSRFRPAMAVCDTQHCGEIFPAK